jgi:hypothetical protein
MNSGRHSHFHPTPPSFFPEVQQCNILLNPLNTNLFQCCTLPDSKCKKPDWVNRGSTASTDRLSGFVISFVTSPLVAPEPWRRRIVIFCPSRVFRSRANCAAQKPHTKCNSATFLRNH